MRFVCSAFFAALGACAETRVPARSQSAVPAIDEPTTKPSGDVGKPPTETTAPTSEPTVEAAPLPALRPFRPADVTPPSERSKAAGDGVWTPWGEPASEPLLFRTTLHPHASSRFIRMDVVAVDLRRVAVHWAIGTRDERAAELAPHLPLGLVPDELAARTVAVFNGGFQLRHGRWGVRSHGVTLQEPKPEGCAVALLGPSADENAAQLVLGTWTALEPRASAYVSVRQTPPCLVEHGELHPWLLQGRDRIWAGQNPALKTRRRSAIGIDASGTTLYYAVGTETQAVDLARGFVALGAATALELDINWWWTRFLLVGSTEEGRRVTEALISDMEYGKREYFASASDRDFFYLVTR